MTQRAGFSEAQSNREQIFAQKLKVVHRTTAKDDRAGYYPLPVRSLHPAVQMPFSLYFKAVTQDDREVRFLPFLGGGEFLAADWLAGLQTLGITCLYLQKDEMPAGLEVFAQYLDAVAAAPEISAAQKVAICYDHLHLSLISAAQPQMLDRYLPFISRQVDGILTRFAAANLPFHLLWEALLRDYSIYRHSVNVFFMTTAFMVSLRHRRADCQAMGMAALFHDMGLLSLPAAVTRKPESLTLIEQAEYKKHPQLGHDLLRRYRAFPGLALRLVLEHHENADGSGFPYSLDLRRQHPLTRILRMVDAYDAMTIHRPDQPGLKPFEALTAMRNQRGRQGLIYDHDLLNKFIRFIGT